MAAKSTKFFKSSSTKLGLDGDLIGALDKFEDAIKEKMLRPAAYAGASIMYDEVHLRVPVKEGTLKSSLFIYYDKARDTPTYKSYLIGPNKRKAPHWHNVEYGHFRYNRWAGRWLRSKSDPNARGPGAHDLPGALEVPVWVPAVPYLRNSYDAKVGACLDRMRERLAELLKDYKA